MYGTHGVFGCHVRNCVPVFLTVLAVRLVPSGTDEERQMKWQRVFYLCKVLSLD